jgi:hypothetical protein
LQANPFLQLDELELEMGEFLDVIVVCRRLSRLRAVTRVPVVLNCGDFPDITQHRFLWLGRFPGLGHVLLPRATLTSDHAFVSSNLYMEKRPRRLCSISMLPLLAKGHETADTGLNTSIYKTVKVQR